MRKWLIGGGIAGVLVVALLVGSLAMTAFAQDPTPPAQTEEQADTDTGPDEQLPSYDSSIRVDDAQYEGTSEADEEAALAGLVTITPEQAKAAALEANPGATVVKMELGNENGALVYEVELDNGLEVKVDAGNGAILSTEQEDADEDDGDLDDVQEEVESQVDDALETPHAEDAPGQ
jgi:uncharacterized membrane protein YkoI